MYVALALLTGGLVSLMIEANGELQFLAGAIPALFAIHLSGLIASGAYAGIGAAVGRRERRNGPSRKPVDGRRHGGGSAREPRDADRRRGGPLWFLLIAGAVGVVVVFLSNEVYRRGGVVLTLMGTLAGQTLGAALLERTRWFEGRRSPRLQRLLSLLLILPGAAVIGWWSGAGIEWIFLSWLPGGVLMVQQMMNTRNAVRFGFRTMLVGNYSSALVALALIVLVVPGIAARPVERFASVPIALLCGGGVLGVLVVGFGSFLLGRVAALKVVLGMYAGQIVVGLLLDRIASRPFAPENAVGVAMVVAGLLAGELPRLRGGDSGAPREA